MRSPLPRQGDRETSPGCGRFQLPPIRNQKKRYVRGERKSDDQFSDESWSALPPRRHYRAAGRGGAPDSRPPLPPRAVGAGHCPPTPDPRPLPPFGGMIYRLPPQRVEAMIDTSRYRVTPGTKVKLSRIATDDDGGLSKGDAPGAITNRCSRDCGEAGIASSSC